MKIEPFDDTGRLKELALSVESWARSGFYSQLSGEMHYMCNLCDSEDAPTWGMVDHHEDCPMILVKRIE